MRALLHSFDSAVVEVGPHPYETGTPSLLQDDHLILVRGGPIQPGALRRNQIRSQRATAPDV